MSFVKRAGLSLLARRGRTLILLALFAVICTLVLGGFLVQRAAESAAEGAKQRVGTEATLQWDMEKAFAKGGFGGTLPDNARLGSAAADRLGRSELVTSHNYTLESGTVPVSAKPVAGVAPPAGLPAEMREDRMLPLLGVRDSTRLRDFRDGHFTLLSGRGIGAEDRDRDAVLVEERFAATNALSVGSRVTLGSAEGKNPREFEVVGVYRDPARSPETWAAPQMEPGNKLIVPLDAIGRLDPSERLDGGMRINEATYLLRDPSTLDRFRKQAEAAGLDLDVFKLDVNDKQYRQLVGPIQNVAAFATGTVWLVGLAGAAVIGLLIALWTRERRRELGVLLAVGERRWRLVAQQIVEVSVVAVLALGAAAAAAQAIAPGVADALVSREVADVPPPVPQQPGRATTEQAPAVAPIDRLNIDLRTRDLRNVALVGLAIVLATVVVPTGRIVRMQPRAILTKGE
ncbi:putative ABC transporter permease YclI [Virgisporangium aliadipatigenens]|uniref:Putative ABC transporter permease YclI n=1 Tax=Virgisporangium aliadipatigenens TaxID=741659 RepID=A0A8J4DV45_9ACTN|nr:FtsX-like permease family protein [Virgisporangium aliadipatigenens]GIJ51444.1 putative ABC transporter permease YclI [Virgisporangium aliadipatigenens]